jgi:AcrR family transcriptional regulator
MVSSVTPLRPDRRRERTRAALIDAGEALFAAKGREGVTIDEIIAAADVAKGSFYNHFPDRDALAREVYRLIRQAVEGEVEAANTGVDDPAVRMARAGCVYVAFALASPRRAGALMRLFAGEAMADSPLNHGVRADLEAGFVAGRFAYITPAAALLMIYGVAQVGMGRALDVTQPPLSADTVGELYGGLLRGLGTPAEDAARIAREAAQALVAPAAKIARLRSAP